MAQALNCNQSEIRGLENILKVNLNAQIMLAVNIDVHVWLNAQIGANERISWDWTTNIRKIYVKFDGAKADLKKKKKKKKISTDVFAKQNPWMPIEKAESNIRILSKSGVTPVIRKTSVC